MTFVIQCVMRRSFLQVTACMVLCYCMGCETSKPPSPALESSQPAGKKLTGEITLSAATSTKEAMEEIAKAYESKTGVKVKVNLGPSSSLANQILEGAPAQLFLSANRQWASKVEEAKLAKELSPLLTNDLVLVVPEGNPAGVKEPKDLAGEAVKKIALAGEKVPAGIYAEQALKKFELLDGLVSGGKIARGQDVRNTLQFVERGEAEAGIVYSTDVQAGSKVEVVHKFDKQLHDEIAYVLVLLNSSENAEAAKDFFEFLQSEEAQAIFSKYGFQKLPAALPAKENG